MELALYCPEYGYYEKERDSVGRGGDFHTSVSVGALFGELLAARFADWLDTIRTGGVSASTTEGENNGRLFLVEAGAHRGDLALDILNWFKRERPDLLSELTYVILEPSPARQKFQARRLGEFASCVTWCSGLDPGSVRGVIFSNELLDAMPLSRARWDAGRREWREMGVAFDGETFQWELMPGAVAMPIPLPEPLLAVLPDGFTTEWSTAATEWWNRSARALKCGWLVTFDYGLEWEDLFDPCRSNGTIRTYHRHRLGDTPLAHPGECDLTAHVNFSEIRRVGEEAALVTDYYGRQGAFLAGIAGLAGKGTGETPVWTDQQLRQLRTLLHPVGFGDSFRVLAQRRA